MPQPVTAQAPIPVAPNTESNWYGWQTLSLDAVAVSAASLGVATQSGSILAFSGVPYVLGAPFIHARHARWGAAAGSLGLRIGLPVLLGVLPGASDDTHSCSSAEADTCGVGPHAAGFGVGVIAAMAIDAAVLAREELPASAPGANDYRARVSYSPMIGIDAKQLKLGLAGTF